VSRRTLGWPSSFIRSTLTPKTVASDQAEARHLGQRIAVGTPTFRGLLKKIEISLRHRQSKAALSAAQFDMIHHVQGRSAAMRRKDSPSASKRTAGMPQWFGGLAASAERARRDVPARVVFPHPLSWWRVRAADEFKEVDVFIARRLLSKSAIIGEPHWFLGAAGDAAVAINVARRAQKHGGVSLVSLDVAMTAVLCIALEGDVAAALFLSAALKRRSDVDPPCGALSDSWLAYNPNVLTASQPR
jgi:hypothetical protein